MDEIEKIANFCQENLDLSNAHVDGENDYNSLSFCVIDSVYSIGVNYGSTKKVVINYCTYFNLIMLRKGNNELPPIEEQEPISNFCQNFEKKGEEFFIKNIFKNKQRTSTRNGIPKAEAVYKFCKVLKDNGIEYLQDIKKLDSSEHFEEEIKKIKGQSSGISLSYFFMLVGLEDFIKPDRMVLRFLENILHKKVDLAEAQDLLVKVSSKLNERYPKLKPRLLDFQIWDYQRRK